MTQLHRIIKLHRAEELTDFSTGFAAADIPHPFRIRRRVRRCTDFNHVAVIQFLGERAGLTIHTAGKRVIADVSMNLVREVNRGGTFRKRNNL